MTGPWPSISGSMRGQIDDAPIAPIFAKFPDTVREYTVTLPTWAEITSGLIASATLACAPSGAGEMQISNLIIVNNELVYTASGGQPGRLYVLKFLVTMTDGTILAIVYRQPITPVLWSDQPIQVPPVYGFGTPIFSSGFLINDNGTVTTTTSGFATSTAGLLPGNFWSNGGEIDAVPGFNSLPNQTPILFSQLTQTRLLGLNASMFPLISPPAGSGQCWINGGILCVA